NLVGAAGAVLMIGGLGLLAWCVMILGASIDSGTGQIGGLIDRGPYRYSRNPLYLAAATVCIGIYLLYAPFQAFDAVKFLVIAALVQFAIVRIEEPATRKRVGPAYDNYT